MYHRFFLNFKELTLSTKTSQSFQASRRIVRSIPNPRSDWRLTSGNLLFLYKCYVCHIYAFSTIILSFIATHYTNQSATKRHRWASAESVVSLWIYKIKGFGFPNKREHWHDTYRFSKTFSLELNSIFGSVSDETKWFSFPLVCLHFSLSDIWYLCI